MENLLTTPLLVAAISGLTYIAYKHKHPRQFGKNIAPPLYLLLLICIFGVLAFFMGRLGPMIESLEKVADSPKTATETAQSLKASYNFTIMSFVYLSAGLAYILFLHKLPSMLDLDQESNKAPSAETHSQE